MTRLGDGAEDTFGAWLFRVDDTQDHQERKRAAGLDPARDGNVVWMSRNVRW